MRTLRIALCLVTGAAGLLGGEAVPLEIRQQLTPYNLQAQRGVPISTVANVPPGSDGRMTTVNQSSDTVAVPTASQFQGLVSYGGVTGLTSSDWQEVSASAFVRGTNAFDGSVAVQMKLPVARSNSVVVMVLRRAQIGAPFLSRQVSALFGSVLNPPEKDENGLLLPPGAQFSYWLPEPYSTNNHQNAEYYWSPHARQVYASRPGPVFVTWRKAQPYTSATFPGSYLDALGGAAVAQTNGANLFLLSTARYIVSGSAFKVPRRIYWTEKAFRSLGKPVTVPAARVGAVNIVYNESTFPKTVAAEYTGIGSTSPVEGNTNNAVLQELRTLWWDQQQGFIYAYNQEGRVMMELLGDLRQDGVTREQLGIEIVDVFRQVNPTDVTIELGERIVPPPPATVEHLFPEPLQQPGGLTFAYRHNVAGSERTEFYATRATVNLNDYLIHWMETGVASLQWPSLLGRYKLVWPSNESRFSHYVRPPAASEAEARETAVALATENVPTIEYQDPFDRPRAKLTEESTFYTWLDGQYPVHRTLLRFISGEDVAFERVFSWLDTSLKSTNFVGTVAADLSGPARFFADQASYPGAYSDYLSQVATYTNDLASYSTAITRGVNGDWKLFVQDHETGDQGAISFWSLVVETTNAAAGTFATSEFTSTGGLTIPDLGQATPFPSTLTVSDVREAVTTVRVTLNGLQHTFPNHLTAILEAPGGQTIHLMNRVGGADPVDISILTFSDAAGSALTAGSSAVTGASLPSPGGSMADLLNPVPPEPIAPIAPAIPTLWTDAFAAPRVVSQVVRVGRRLTAPSGELGATGGYVAGHINLAVGNSFNSGAYTDPLADGFEAANQGAIIPVNAIPGANQLEVWWPRTNAANAGPNAGNGAKGFLPIFWPSVIGRYTIEWPGPDDATVPEIVLASNDGSGGLPSLQATGGIYVQNDATRPGYNPNEEHALMQGGQAYALRDDLNITTSTNGEYSSHPFVLLDYIDSDGRPSMTPFRVLREKGNVTFFYEVEAGAILQPPMPLPLLEKPLGPKFIGENPRSLNQETYFRTVAASTAGGELTTVEPNHFRPYFRELALQSPDFATLRWFIVTNAVYAANTLSGVVSEIPPLHLGSGALVSDAAVTVEETSRSFDHSAAESDGNGGTIPAYNDWTLTSKVTVARVLEYDRGTTDPSGLTNGQPVYLVAPTLGLTWVAEVTGLVDGSSALRLAWSASTTVTATLELDGDAAGVPAPPALDAGSAEVVNVVPGLTNQLPAAIEVAQGKRLFVPAAGLADGQFNGWQLRTEPVPASLSTQDASFTLQDRKGNLWIYRGPHDEADSPYLAMQFYYKTLPGFFFPSVALAGQPQPPPGVITPYLRSQEADGTYAGDPVYGNAIHVKEGDDNAMLVSYRPVWPASAPVLQMAETLTVPKRGLPAVRGQSSLQILYQQSAVTNAGRITVRLHDPTRLKGFKLGPSDGIARLGRIPDSVKTSVFRGRTYFPNLPPHLSERFFLDPNDSPNGTLFLGGEFVDDPTGEKYILLNVLSPRETESLQGLCLADDPAYDRWTDAISQLETTMERFVEAPQKPGTFLAGETRPKGPSELAEVWDDDVAVDSYALTAIGPGTGYVTLVAGNGLAFTPAEEPVSVKVIRVVPNLYPGEVKVILSSNPLAEKVTLQQVVDLAAETQDYEFEWMIASPVDGFPPPVYDSTPTSLLAGGSWTHIPFPLSTDAIATLSQTEGTRTAPIALNVQAVNRVPFSSVTAKDGNLEFAVTGSLASLTPGNRVTVQAYETPTTLKDYPGTIVEVAASKVVVALDVGGIPITPAGLVERSTEGIPQSLLYRTFTVPPAHYSELWLSLNLDDFLGARVFLDGELVVTAHRDLGNTATNSAPGYLSPLATLYQLDPSILDRGPGDGTHQVAIELFSSAFPDVPQAFDLKLEALVSVDLTQASNDWLPLDATKYPDGVRSVIGETADVRSLSDNYLIMRYRATNEVHASFASSWSRWTTPKLAAGWIKRVLAGLNPFNQRLTDLFNNQVNTDVSMLTQAGRRYEGDIALNLDAINSYGLIEIYETVLRRGRLLSIDGGINFGPANDALLLAAGYLSDLYLMLGNESFADAANPTIGIGTADHTYGDIATALFAFKGQEPSLLEEELALLRGRDDFFQPGVEVPPFYNRLVWNYTRGIDAGEVIYALNYNIQENPNQDPDGIINAEDAALMFPQGHGDAYGHYLTALKGYYSLLSNSKFDWVPRIEAVNVLGQPVSVDYQDERKFAAAAAALTRAGQQIFDLTWRKDYQPVAAAGWEQFGATRLNSQRSPAPSTRYWGLDHWATRTGQGTFLNWVVGNAILPDVDPNPDHEGIQKVDRTTVPELQELASLAGSLQTALDNAEGGLSPLGIPQGGLAFDVNPNTVVGPDGGTHFDQVYRRAIVALNNAVAAFDDAKDVTRLMRSEEDSLADLRNQVVEQELAYRNALIELYGTPYPDDMGPGKTWKQDYTGPDSLHYMYVETPEQSFPGLWNYPGDTSGTVTYKIDVTDLPKNWGTDISYTDFTRTGANSDGVVEWDIANSNYSADYTNGAYFIEYNLAPHGFSRPAEWTGRRNSPGKIQEAISQQISAHTRLSQALYDELAAKATLDRNIALFEAEITTYGAIRDHQRALLRAQEVLRSTVTANDLWQSYQDEIAQGIRDLAAIGAKALPTSLIAGVAAGGDATSPARAALESAAKVAAEVVDGTALIRNSVVKLFALATELAELEVNFSLIEPLARNQELRSAMADIGSQFEAMQEQLWGINLRLREYDSARRNLQGLLAQADRIQEEREIFRKRGAALVQGYRTRDAAFRIFRAEKLERYKTLFELAARYSLLAANAYDYETGLLDTSAGRAFVNRIINARALGVVRNGEPQFAGSNTGDPGLSSVLAEMKADWEVLRGRLGFNNPDAYGTTVSLRQENLRILPGADGDTNWKDIMQRARVGNVLDDADVRRHCMQISNGDGLPVPGLIVTFSTTIADGYNLFGRALAAGDHNFSPSSFATKIFGVGVALEGYRGMDDPAANGGAVGGSGGSSPGDPDGSNLDPQALAATPYLYLIPVGVDSMRSPPLGDVSTVRSWSVNDLAIPMPFNIGASDFSNQQLWQSSDSLTEPLFAIRKHQAFRPVSTNSVFSASLYGVNGTLQRSQFTNNRLVGRSVWNSQWKLVIPGKTLLNDPNEGLERFIQTVKDIKLHFVTYSYSGN